MVTPPAAGPARGAGRVSGRGVTQITGQTLRAGLPHRHTLVDIDIHDTELHVHDLSGELLASIPRTSHKPAVRLKRYASAITLARARVRFGVRARRHDPPDAHPENRPEDRNAAVVVLLHGQERQGHLTLTRPAAGSGTGPSWQLHPAAGGQRWTGSGHQVFAAVHALMADLDRDGAQIGVNGARPNEWASGMLADMGDDKNVYLLQAHWTPQPPRCHPWAHHHRTADARTVLSSTRQRRLDIPRF